jgi:hypothetical protein
MPERARRQLPCHGCGINGRYRGTELVVRIDSYYLWKHRFLCAACEVMLLELAGVYDGYADRPSFKQTREATPSSRRRGVATSWSASPWNQS